MSRLRPGGRHGGRGGRSDDWATPHERALAGASERLDGPLPADEATWLETHLADCEACRAAATDFAAQRLELRGLRDRAPQPPRDLWARTAAAIEREAGFRAHQPRSRSIRTLLIPLAALGGTVAVAVVVGTLTSSRLVPGDATPPPSEVDVRSSTPDAASPPLVPGPTPLAVDNERVAWLAIETDGTVSMNVATVDEVCPPSAAACRDAAEYQARALSLATTPSTVFGSTDGQRLIVVSDGSATDPGGSLVVVPVSTGAPTATPSPSPSPTPSPTTEPTSSPTDEASPTPSVTPSDATATPSPSVSPSVSSDPSGAIEIARDVEVVDLTAAYSPGGSEFAFTARPSDGSAGPDIYVWRVGESAAAAVTTDHRSVFGSWSEDLVVGSTAVTDEAGVTTPSAFVLDPATGELRLLVEAGPAWRPVVDPTGWNAVYWRGTLAPTADGLGWTAADGALVVGTWPALADEEGEPSSAPSGEPVAGASQRPGASPSGRPRPSAGSDPSGSPDPSAGPTVLADGPVGEWDARWDADGTHLAVWIADPEDPTVGRLSLYVVDPFDGTIDLTDPLLADAPAQPGFSISDGRLVWVEPDAGGDTGASKDGRILILAWNEEGSGTISSASGEVIVVR